MKSNKLTSILSLILFTGPGLRAHNCDFEHQLVLEETRELEFDPSMGHQEVVVDNVNGSIHVEGYDGDIVRLEVKRTITARSESRLEVAQEDVWLDIKEDGDAITVYVEGPFRNKSGEINHRGCRYYGYNNRFDFILRVPSKAEVYLRNMNGGDITAENLVGKFDLKNLNGRIEMQSMSGYGRAYSLNGRVTASFQKNPAKDCYFGSLNGKVEVEFQSGLNADLSFKTRNGKVYSDFEVARLPTDSKGKGPPKVAQKKDGMRVYKSNEFNAVRVGKGGPRFEFDTFNGNTVIKKSKS